MMKISLKENRDKVVEIEMIMVLLLMMMTSLSQQ